MSDEKDISESPQIYFKASSFGDELVNHVKQLQKCEELQIGDCFILDRSAYKLELIKDLLKTYCVGKVAIVVIDHPEHGQFEIKRFSDGIDIKLIYKYYPTSFEESSQIETDTGESKIIMFCKEYLMRDISVFLTYDKNLTSEMKNAGIFSYSMMSRKLGCMAVFIKSPNGRKNSLKLCLQSVVNAGYLSLVDRQYAKDKFNSSANLYEINKENF